MKIRNIVFSGFMASILMAGGAYADPLTTKTYVDDGIKYAVSEATSKAGTAETNAKKYTDDKVGDLGTSGTVVAYITSAIDGVTGDASTLSNKVNGIDTRLTAAEKDIDDLEDAVGDSTKGLVKAVADLDNAKADSATTLAGYGITDAYTKAEVNTELGKKANSATSLSGYGITDAYTKAEVNTELAKKVNVVSGSSLVSDTKVAAYDEHIEDATIHVTSSDKTTWSGKQDAISDLDTIRTGAAAGATAVQPAALNAYTKTADLKDAAKSVCGNAAGDLCYINNSGGLTKIDTISAWEDLD